jgi:hypothetical protein
MPLLWEVEKLQEDVNEKCENSVWPLFAFVVCRESIFRRWKTGCFPRGGGGGGQGKTYRFLCVLNTPRGRKYQKLKSYAFFVIER